MAGGPGGGFGGGGCCFRGDFGGLGGHSMTITMSQMANRSTQACNLSSLPISIMRRHDSSIPLQH